MLLVCTNISIRHLHFLCAVHIHSGRYQVFKTEALSKVQAEALLKLPKVDFWREPAEGKEAQIVVGPAEKGVADKMFELLEIKHSILIEDLKV